MASRWTEICAAQIQAGLYANLMQHGSAPGHMNMDHMHGENQAGKI